MDKEKIQLQIEPEPPQIEIVSQERFYCDGGPNPALGHPRVYLTLNKVTRTVDCPYCDKRFIHESIA